MKDRTICEVSGHKNPASLAAYDRVTSQKAIELSAASSTSSFSATSSNSVPFVFNAAGASFANSTVTVNIAPPARKRKKLSMQLKKMTQQLESQHRTHTEEEQEAFAAAQQDG